MSVRSIEAEVSIKSGIEAECSIGREVIVEVHEEAVLEPLTATANGNYTPSHGVDGFSGVTVSVPERIPMTESLSVTENGTYEPTEGIDGYDRVTVAVPPTVPDIEPLTVTANGTYTAEGDGFSPVTVNVVPPTDPDICEGEFIGTETGVLTIDTGYEGDGFPKILEIVPVIGAMDDSFLSETLRYSINSISGIKDKHTTPTYSDGTASNKMRTILSYKSSDSAYTSHASLYTYYAQDNPGFGGASCVRFSDKRTLKVYVSDTQSGSSAFIPTGIRYKYRIVY